MQQPPKRKVVARQHGTGHNVSKARRARFIDAYISNGQNGRQAAIALGVRPSQADNFHQTLIKHPKVAEEIARRLTELAAPHALTAQEVIASLARALRFDPAKLYYTDGPKKGQLKHVFDMDEDTRLELAGIEIEETIIGDTAKLRTAKVKQPNKQGARDQGMRYFGLNKKDNEQRTVDPDEVAAKVRAKLAQIGNATEGKKK